MELLGKSLQILGVLLSFIFVAGLAYFVTKFIGIKYSNQLKSKNMQVVESLSLGVDRTLHLVKIGGKICLIAVSGKQIEYLTEISVNEIVLESRKEQQNINFRQYIQEFKDKYK